MRAGYVWLAYFAIYPLLGAPLVSHAGFRRFGRATRIVLSGGIGAVALTWTMTVWALAGWRWGPPVFLAALAVSAALRPLLRASRDPSASPPARGGGSPRLAVALSITLAATATAAALLATASARSTSPDLVLFWGPKAQQFAAARTIDVAFLTAPYLDYLHVYYPPLVTNVFAVGTIFAGRLPWGAVTLTFPLLLGATAVGLAGAFRTGTPGIAEKSPARAWATAALAVSALGLIGIDASVAGNAEPFLWFFEAVGLATLLASPGTSDVGRLVAGLFFAGAAASKVEGLPFVLAAVALYLLFDRDARGEAGRTISLLLAPTVAFLGAWFAFGATRRLFYGYHGYGPLLDVRWDHVDEVLAGFGVAFWRSGYALPFVVPLLALAAARGRIRPALVPLGVAAALAAFISFTYLHGENDPRLWIGWSAARVFSPVTALLALAAHLRSAVGGEATPSDTLRPSPR